MLAAWYANVGGDPFGHGASPTASLGASASPLPAAHYTRDRAACGSVSMSASLKAIISFLASMARNALRSWT